MGIFVACVLLVYLSVKTFDFGFEGSISTGYRNAGRSYWECTCQISFFVDVQPLQEDKACGMVSCSQLFLLFVHVFLNFGCFHV